MLLSFKVAAAALLFPLLMQFSYAADVQPIAQDLNGQEQSVQLIRNATVKVKFNGVTFLVDPMLAPKGSYSGFTGTLHSEIRNHDSADNEDSGNPERRRCGSFDSYA